MGDKGFKPASSTDNIRHDTITIYEWTFTVLLFKS